MRLVIVRHAESAYNIQNRIQGHIDSGLTERGRAQARLLSRRLRDVSIDRVYSSDLGRAFTTTREILRHKRLRVVRDPLLREIRLGAWEGMTPEEVDRLYDRGYQKWLRKPSAMRIPRAEPVAAFRRRVTSRVRAIARANRGRTVLVVTHGGVITALLAEWLEADFDHLLLNLQIDNTSLTMVDWTEARRRLRFINDATHLESMKGHDLLRTPQHS